MELNDYNSNIYRVSGFFLRVTQFVKIGKRVTLFAAVILRFKKFPLANNTGYNFCALNFLRCKIDRENMENQIMEKITGTYFFN